MKPVQVARSKKFIALRNLTVAITLVLIGWLIARTWVARSAIIMSESMAPALLGPHLSVTCDTCKQTTKVGMTEDACQNLEVDRPVACQNCGTLIPLPSHSPIQPGESLLVYRNLIFTRPLTRWDIIACRDPLSPETIIVKRLVGLPGETIQIIGGDIFINGKIARKSFDQQASSAILVYNASHETDRPASENRSKQSSASPLRRWIPNPENQENSGWSVQNGHFQFTETKVTAKEKDVKEKGKNHADRLTYHHRYRADGKMFTGPVIDQLAYNQWFPIRRDRFHPVSDLMLTFHLCRNAGEGFLKVFTAEDRYLITFDYKKKKVTVHQPSLIDSGLANNTTTPETKNRLLAEAPFNPPPENRPLPILISTVDRCLMVVVDQNVVIKQLLPESTPSSPTPFSFEAAGLDLNLDRIRIYRDVYYAEPATMHARWALQKPVILGEDEYFILGDNPRVSQDSRTWPQGPGISRSEIFGRP